MRQHLSISAIQRKLASDLQDGKDVLIREGETLRREPDGSIWRIVNDRKEKIDDRRDVRAFLKIAANFFQKQLLASEGKW